MPKYKNPPVAEAWIAFDFEPTPDKTEWGPEQVQEFANAYPNFATMNTFYKETFRLEKTDEKSVPRVTNRSNVLDVARMSNEENTRLRQLANDRIAYNLIRKAGDDYPGFQTLLTEALEYREQYEAFFQPASTKLATIHYIDVIDIPGNGEPILLNEYFNFIPDIPEDPFGLTIGYSLAFGTKCPFDDAPMQTTLAWVPSADPNKLRIRMDWEKSCLAVNHGNIEETKASLNQSQQFMVDCFEKILTDKTRELFG